MHRRHVSSLFFFFNDPATPEIYPLSLHDALPIWCRLGDLHEPPIQLDQPCLHMIDRQLIVLQQRSEEHTSELQSPCNLVCRLLLEKKKKHIHTQRARSPTRMHMPDAWILALSRSY